MAIQTLTALNALSPGSELWIVADSEHSKWTRKIDWYLNFQFQKAEAHASPQISNELKNLLSTWNIEVHSDMTADSSVDNKILALPASAPVMIASANLLPATQTVLIPWPKSGDTRSEEGLESWAESCQKIWQGLQRPTMRVFLPDGVRIEEFDRICERICQRSGAKEGMSVAHIEVVSSHELQSE